MFIYILILFTLSYISYIISYIELIDKKPYNKSVDVYSFAVLIWEIVTAEIPFKMIDRNEICQR